jgi:Tol biopolymer transport system component
MDCYASAAQSGSIYFHGFDYTDGRGGADLYRATLEGESYAVPENLGDAVNTPQHDWDVFVAPDESYLIFASVDRPDGLGEGDLYISFARSDGSWATAKNLGEPINSSANEICPSVSPDGQYLFFTSDRTGVSEVHWVDTAFISELGSSDR